MARILLVDDDPGIRRTVGMLLRRERHQVTEMETVADAVGRMKRERYDLVIADLRMEPLDGLDLLVLNRARGSSAPVLIMTAYGTDETRSQAKELGAADLVDKSLQAPAFLQRVRAIVPEPA